MSLDRVLPMPHPGQLSSYLPLHSGHRLCPWSHMRNLEIGPTARWYTLDPHIIKLFSNILPIPFIWYQVCEDPLSLIFFLKNQTKSKSSQTLHSSCDQCLTWSEKHWTSQILPHRWPNGPGSHLGMPRHVWDWFVRFWFFLTLSHCCVGGWRCLDQKSSHSLPYRWPKCPSSHPQLIWILDWGPGQVSAWSERISISVENLSMFKSSQTLHSSVSGLTLDIETGPTARWCILDPTLIKLFSLIFTIPFIWYQVWEDPWRLNFFLKNLVKSKSSQKLLSTFTRTLRLAPQLGGAS